jgi:hypothetical protein
VHTRLAILRVLLEGRGGEAGKGCTNTVNTTSPQGNPFHSCIAALFSCLCERGLPVSSIVHVKLCACQALSFCLHQTKRPVCTEGQFCCGKVHTRHSAPAIHPTVAHGRCDGTHPTTTNLASLLPMSPPAHSRTAHLHILRDETRILNRGYEVPWACAPGAGLRNCALGLGLGQNQA